MLQLRPHHICCLRFWSTMFEERGAGFLQVEDKIKNNLLSQPEMTITVLEGVDELCRQCPLCVNERCSSPKGNEDKVRQWDSMLLTELGLPFGACLTAGEWQELINQKTPFKLCPKCQWQQVCSIGANL